MERYHSAECRVPAHTKLQVDWPTTADASHSGEFIDIESLSENRFDFESFDCLPTIYRYIRIAKFVVGGKVIGRLFADLELY